MMSVCADSNTKSYRRPPLRALVVDDEVALARLVAGYLARGGFDVEVAFDGSKAVTTARGFEPDLVVLDVILPGLDGIEVCRELRAFSDCYVIMLTARVDEREKLAGLATGADDYLTKPFSPRELLARSRAMLRRPRVSARGGRTRSALTFGALSLDLDGREIRVDGARIDVTPLEFEMLTALARNPTRAQTRRDLIEAVWGRNWVGDEHLVDVHIRNLRRKLGDDAADPRFIRTIRGFGYRMADGG
jgi:DNA-binding response OmpR family regulator